MLTPAERKVYDQFVKPQSYQDIMAVLNLSLGGVRFHVNNLFNKLDFSSRIEMVCDYYASNSDFKYQIPSCLNDQTVNEKVFVYTVNGWKTEDTAKLMNVSKSYVAFARRRIYTLANVKNSLELVHKCWRRK